MKIVHDYYLVGLSDLHEQLPSMLVTPSPQELALAGMTKEQIQTEEDKVIKEVSRIRAKYANPRTALKAVVEFLDSVGWMLFKKAGQIMIARIPEDPNKEAHPSQNIRYYGSIESIPMLISDTFFDTADNGFPSPLKYKPSEKLAQMTNPKYVCSDLVSKHVLLSDVYKPRFHNCDTLYFFWDARSEDNYFYTKRDKNNETGKESERYVFKIHCTEVICGTSIVDGELKVEMNDQMLLIEPLPMSPENIKTLSGIYVQTSSEGSVAQFGTIVHGENAGMVVSFEDNVALPVVVAGKKYLALNQLFLLAYIVDGNPKPVKGHVLIKPDKPTEKTNAGVYLPKKDRKMNDRAEVIDIGDDVKSVSIGDRVLFGKGHGLGISKDKYHGMLIIKEIDLVGII